MYEAYNKMTIIKQGSMAKRTMRFKCLACKCEFEMAQDEQEVWERSQRDIIIDHAPPYFTKCPICKYWAVGGSQWSDVMKVEGCDIVNNGEVYGLQESIRGAKFPMSINVGALNSDLTNGIKNLAQSPSGEGHDQWLTGVVVQFDLTFSIKAWVEAERYHFFDFVSSQSTMHRITKMPVESQMNQYVDQRTVSILREHIDAYNNDATPQNYLRVLYNTPTGFKLTARMTTNYRQLKTIYRQRKTHRLPQWRKFCEWVETLPMHELITGELE